MDFLEGNYNDSLVHVDGQKKRSLALLKSVEGVTQDLQKTQHVSEEIFRELSEVKVGRGR